MKKYLLFACVLLSACVPPTLPPIIITPAPPPSATPAPEPAPKPKATLAFQVVNACDGQPIRTAFVSVTDGPTKQVNDDGYLALELEAGGAIYLVAFGEPDYRQQSRQYQVDRNRQFDIRLMPTAGCPKPEPPPPVEPIPATPVTPPVVVPPAPTSKLCAMRDTDPLGCVRQVAAVYPHLLQINTFASTTEFTQRVLEVLGEPWGHVGKTAGEGQGVPRGFTPMVVEGFQITGVSYDAIKNRVTGQVIDLLGNATANEPCNLPPADCWKPVPAQIQWANVPPEHWRANNPFVPAVPVR